MQLAERNHRHVQYNLLKTMLKWLRKFFMNDADNICAKDGLKLIAENANNAIEDINSAYNELQQQQSKNAQKKKRFQIDIFDKIVSGTPPNEKVILQKVHYDNPVILEASSKKELQDFADKLSICQQTFKIVKVLDDSPSPATTDSANAQQQQVNDNNAPRISQLTGKIMKTVPVHRNINFKPKYYRVGDIELKDDNGTIFQKQWLRLSEAEAANFRIINDKSNSIFNLKDKHIEMKKWVLVDSTDNDNDLEEQLA